MKKLFLFLFMFIYCQVKAQNTSYDSAAVLIGGINNVGIGIGVLKVNAGQRNVGVGIGALENSGVASDNTAIGYHAMNESVGTFFNTAVGKEALKKNQSQYNTALGWGAMTSNIGGESNTATGGLALGLNVSGSFNTANGYLSLFSNTNGNGNTGVGMQSLYNNALGNYNTATGNKALYNNLGSYNTATGYNALIANTSGEANTANGYQSFFNNTTGTWGTAIGHGALYHNTTGNNNTATGLLSLFNSTTGNNNTAHGRDALLNNITGDNNSAFGFGADVLSGALTNATAIGYNAKVAESNAIQLGNAGVAKVFNGVGNNATFITGGLQVTGGTPAVGKVLTSDASGIATWQTPVAGIGGSGTLNYVSKFTPDGFTLGNSQIFDNGTNIGIGTASPVAKLDITGNIKITDGSQGTGKVLTSDANGLATWQTAAVATPTWSLLGNAGTVDGVNFIGTTDNVPFNIRVNNQKAGRIEAGGHVGTFYGFQAGALNSAGMNTAMGFRALAANTTGFGNTATGNGALTANTVGGLNSAYGFLSLAQNTTGGENSAFGWDVLRTNTTGSGNTSIGRQSLRFNTTGSANTANGSSALFANTTGRYNTASGANALSLNTTGINNTALGAFADVSSGTLTNATAIGYNAMVQQSNAIQLGDAAVTRVFNGVGNAATFVTGGLQVTGGSPGVGKVLTSNATGVATWQTAAVATPSWSLTGNAGTVDGTNFIGTTDNVPLNFRVNNQKAGRIESSSNTANTFMGFRSGNVNSGAYNTAFGYSALALNSGASGNTATGTFALSVNVGGNYNSAFGGEALSSNRNGNFNTAIGNTAMVNNENGGRNTAIGVDALGDNINGGRNTAVGFFALGSNISGDFNTALGTNANVALGNLTNATAIGANASVNASNKVRIGDGAVSVIEGTVVYTVSDGRFKRNIKTEDVKGLDFIKKLRPVVYNFEAKEFQQFLIKNVPDSLRKQYLDKDFAPATSIRQSGFIAQEVEKAAKETGYNFNGVHIPESKDDNYSLAYSQFVVPLVKAMQEQQLMIEKLQKEVEELKKSPIADMKVNAETIELSDKSNIVLNQNVPNPFAQQTSISYNIPANAGTAQMLFYTMDGRLMKTANLTARGKGVLNVYANDLSSGNYTYSLVVDGKPIDTKKMVKQ